mgnify:CR=1 FL=1
MNHRLRNPTDREISRIIFCSPSSNVIYTCKSPSRSDSGKATAESKGVNCEVKSEGSHNDYGTCKARISLYNRHLYQIASQLENRRMPNGTYGGVRGRKTKVGRKLLRFPPTRLCLLLPSFVA